VAESKLATTTYNLDVFGVQRRYNRIIVELTKAVSSGVSLTNSFDVARAQSYLKAMGSYLKWAHEEPKLDCPETGPTEQQLQANPPIPAIENESLYDLMQLVVIARDELCNSQSARNPFGIIDFDYTRQTTYLAKMTSLIDFIIANEPLDLPESSPMDPISGPGQQGV